MESDPKEKPMASNLIRPGAMAVKPVTVKTSSATHKAPGASPNKPSVMPKPGGCHVKNGSVK